MNITFEIRPISPKEWLPDRCISIKEPLEIHNLTPRYGCPSLLSGQLQIRNRTGFEEFYHLVLNRYGCCGFVAWEKGSVIGYTNFFPHEIAQKTKFYGWGGTDVEQSGTLVHHCISIVQNLDYRHKGVGTGLIRRSLEWAKAHQWKRYEVHQVLPDIDQGAVSDQKSILSFWRKIGFSIIREEDADEETKRYYGVDKRYSLALDIDSF